MDDKSHVGMFNCPICGEPIGILLDKQLRNRIPRNNIIGPELCDKCKKKYKENNQIVLYEATLESNGKPNITGRYVIISDEIINNEQNPQKKAFMDKERIAFCDNKVYELIVGKITKNGETSDKS